MRIKIKENSKSRPVWVESDSFIEQGILPRIPPNSYTHPSTHPALMITEDVNHNFVTAEQKSNIHAPGGGADPWTIIKLSGDFVTSLIANTNVTNFFFTPVANKTYLIFGYFLLQTALATVGARPGVVWPLNIIDATIRIEAANSLTTSALQLFGARTTKNAASTGLATTTNSHWGSLDGIMITASNVSGNFQVTLATETAGTNVTMKAGSILMYREL